MFRLMLSLLLVCSLNSIGYSQLFPNAFWNKGKTTTSNQVCTGPECAGQSVTVVETVTQPMVYYPPTQTYSPVVNYSCGSTGSAVYSQTVVNQTYGSISSSIASPLVASVSTVEVMRKKNSFKTVFVEAVKRSREAGEINAIEAAALRLKANNPNFLRNAEIACADAAIAEGVVSATAQIDWDALLAFIEKLIPLILKLIDAFAYVQPYADYMYANSSSYYDFHTAA